MKNKELAINKIEKIENQLKTLDFSVRRGEVQEYDESLKRVREQLEELRSLISIEQNTF